MHRTVIVFLLVPLACVVALWVRSCVVGEIYVVETQQAVWPNGVALDVPYGSLKPRDWVAAGSPPSLRRRRQWFSSGYGRFEFKTSVLEWPTLTQRHLPNVEWQSSECLGRYKATRYMSGSVKWWSAAWLFSSGKLAGSLAVNVDLFGFSYQRSLGRSEGGIGYDTRVVVVPYWMPSLALATPVAYRWLRRRARRRALSGRCSRCGYDLRASRERCPECGTAIAGKAGAATSIG